MTNSEGSHRRLAARRRLRCPHVPRPLSAGVFLHRQSSGWMPASRSRLVARTRPLVLARRDGPSSDRRSSPRFLPPHRQTNHRVGTRGRSPRRSAREPTRRSRADPRSWRPPRDGPLGDPRLSFAREHEATRKTPGSTRRTSARLSEPGPVDREEDGFEEGDLHLVAAEGPDAIHGPIEPVGSPRPPSRRSRPGSRR